MEHNKKIAEKKRSFHDLVCVGNVAEAFDLIKEDPLTSSRKKHQLLGLTIDDNPVKLRLTSLLRLLLEAESVAKVPSLESVSADRKTSVASDPFVDRTVALLEDVGASHQEVETVEPLVAHYAISATRRINRFPPLQKTIEGVWLVADLEHSSKRRKIATENTADGDAIDTGDEEDENDDFTTANRSFTRRLSELESRSQEDSLEALVCQVLEETTTLVKASLAEKEQSGEDEDETLSSRIQPTMILSESMEIGDLGSAVAATAHRATILRHSHIAKALCVAAIPDSPSIIQSLGANCPSSVQCLLHGCLATNKTDTASEDWATSSILKLAELSPCETDRIVGNLHRQQMRADLQLRLLLQAGDPLPFATLIVEEFSDVSSPLPGSMTEEEVIKVSTIYHSLYEKVSTARSGERRVLLKAICWMLFRLPCAQLPSQSYLNQVMDGDQTFSLVLCACILHCARIFGDETEHEPTTTLHHLQELLNSPPTKSSSVFVSLVSQELLLGDVKSLIGLLFAKISIGSCLIPISDGFSLMVNKFKTFVRTKWNLTSAVDGGLSKGAVLCDPTGLIQALERELSTASRVEYLFNDKDVGYQLMRNHGSSLVRLLSLVASSGHNLGLPIVSNTSLSRLVRGVDLDEMKGLEWNESHAQVAINFAYSVFFFRLNPLSPFAINPLDNMSLVTVVMETKVDFPGAKCLTNAVSKAMRDLYPSFEPRHCHQFSAVMDLRKASQDFNESDGKQIEKLFVARDKSMRVPHASGFDLDLNNSLQWERLRKDPVAIFRLTAVHWKNRGVRRVLLSLLQDLLQEHEAAAKIEQGAAKEERLELLSSRNLLTLCVLLRCRNSRQSGAPCVATLSTMRSLVGDSEGLVAALVRCGLSKGSLPSLMRFVPEVVNDSGDVVRLLEEGNWLRNDEKLSSAALGLSVALTSGFGKSDVASSLAGGSVKNVKSVDLSSNNEWMIRVFIPLAQQVIGSLETVQMDCAAGLHEVMLACKEEASVAMVTGASASKQNSKLKETYDATLRALNVMGVYLG